jgi:hypothetical protein
MLLVVSKPGKTASVMLKTGGLIPVILKSGRADSVSNLDISVSAVLK